MPPIASKQRWAKCSIICNTADSTCVTDQNLMHFEWCNHICTKQSWSEGLTNIRSLLLKLCVKNENSDSASNETSCIFATLVSSTRFAYLDMYCHPSKFILLIFSTPCLLTTSKNIHCIRTLLASAQCTSMLNQQERKVILIELSQFE